MYWRCLLHHQRELQQQEALIGQLVQTKVKQQTMRADEVFNPQVAQECYLQAPSLAQLSLECHDQPAVCYTSRNASCTCTCRGSCVRSSTPAVPVSSASSITLASAAVAATPSSLPGLDWKAATRFSAGIICSSTNGSVNGLTRLVLQYVLQGLPADA